ncbi:pyridoxal phosphate-dependent decarboxylase family protein [Fodinibius halophilus]|uniref:Aminotransferase class V-fold PLP-dependent enzyme n=1 Tax=Fodinibius halophilus TaxID=1736908 RepID=A0A6M1T7I0_9BACT|nr:aminotransferase class V-fold PLP-dependent enzyme [Fodinibius halophilus]NGP90187.1 aminotransferase class V-fold PLP-dependent enzyme [Fodinibius halophilus]
MDQQKFPANAFINPSGTNKEGIENFISKALHRIISVISSSETRSPLPGEIDIPNQPIPEESIGDEQLIDHLETLLLSSINPSHPGWLPHMDPPPTTASLIADFATASVNNNMLSVEMSPAFSRLEQQVVRKICQMFNLGQKASGVLCSGGSLANLQALAVARNKKLSTKEGGIQELPKKPILFASKVAHTSIQKAAMILGLGQDSVQPIPVDSDSQMITEELEAAINQAKNDGKLPFCVVATAGTTTTGNIDPLEDIGSITQQENLWYHVDAAYGGALVFSNSHHDKLAGISKADSITFNPQKWLYVAKTSAMVLFKDQDHLVNSFKVGAPYMEQDEERINLGEISLQGTRHADILKLWASFQHIGRKGFQQLIDQSYQLTNLLHDKLKVIDCIQLASTPKMNIICFRGQPKWITSARWDEWNKGLQEYLLENHKIFFSLPTYNDSKWLRTVILNPFVNKQSINNINQGITSYIRKTQ